MGLNLATHKKKRSLAPAIGLFLILLLMLSNWLSLGSTLRAESESRRPADRQFESAIPRQGPGAPGLQEELAKGKLLVASRRLSDPNFSETVVLLIEYGPDGAMGLVINRPSAVKLSTVFPDVKELKQRNDTIYVGGPVGVNQMLMLIRTTQTPEQSRSVIDDVYISSSWKVLEHLMKKATGEQRFRLFAGYAGWAPSQLDFERTRGDWHVLKADAETVFTLDPKALWQELIRRATVKWVQLERRRNKPN